MIEKTLFDTISPVLSGRLYPAIAPQGSARPYGVYSEISSIQENTLSDGITIQNSLFQISVWDVSYLGVKTLGESISTLMAGAFTSGSMYGVQRSRHSTYEAVTSLHGIIYEFSLWHYDPA